MVRCVDEKTRWQPRPRTTSTWAAPPGPPVRVEHEDARTGALHLFASFDTRPGQGDATTAERKRQGECRPFLAHLERESTPSIKTIPGVLEKVRRHQGQQGPAWLATPPRFVCHFPPGQCSWRNYVEPWGSILQRKRRLADVADKKPLAQRWLAFVAAWNTYAHPFQWSTTSVANVLATCESALAKAASFHPPFTGSCTKGQI